MPTPVAINRTMTPVEWALLGSLATLWGGSYFFNALAVAQLPTFTIVAARVTLGALFLSIALKVSGRHLPRDLSNWRAFAVMGLLNNVVPFSLVAWGQSGIASGLASILNATTPMFTVLVAHWFTHDERMTPLRVGGIVVGFLGVIVMIGGDAIGLAGRHLLNELACVAAALSYALSVVYGRRFAARGLAPMATATGQMLSSTVMIIPIALLIDRPWTLPFPGPAALVALVGLGLLSTAVAYVVYYRILATAGSVNLMLVTLLVPVAAVILGAVVLGERLSPNHFAGMAAIAIGLAAIDGRVFRTMRRRTA